MATHRRGLRPSQWPVRDLLGPDAERGRLWDARVGAAVAGLLACGAAVTVVLTSGETAASKAPTPAPQPGPLALPAPPPAVSAPGHPDRPAGAVRCAATRPGPRPAGAPARRAAAPRATGRPPGADPAPRSCGPGLPATADARRADRGRDRAAG